ncbi:Type I phosphodiesterase / nucleotide pyrophosphatase [Candidatus Methanoperedens nitroreducens]|uniref:Type I phosphodiesterase / nucleotide pyrophosphatase n=1 Tax=Candidatus Methanoperedens nitratireducens TaxID=1392998 RepID=A0A062V483_9EURY|nr:alkaline phosphatase family protein [Candidatus Methanoperedens nitroreducens]KCZ70624.1 Type I phosphodiesterase / nucleotide pyrophosphatase [Candidatus Methanoperedens nitroreducens]MDJ1420480.1 alkaline phosphatase family protein [Candidatus Methanoperedens sp.]
MIVVLAIDALEYTLVEEFNCKNLKQRFYGKTNIKEFSEPKTMVLWSSFMTGKNMEKEIVARGDKEMWNTELDMEDTFFRSFKNPKIIDLPGFSYIKEQHEQERRMLKYYFDAQSEEEKKNIRTEYNNLAFLHHRRIKQEFSTALQGDYDFVLGYFSVADVIGHLNFGNGSMMKLIYRDLDEIAGTINHTLIVLSDHGMERVGIFGDHSNYGFWSTDLKDLGNPKITDFADMIKEIPEVN